MKELVKPNVVNDELHLIENYCESHTITCGLGCACKEATLDSIEEDGEVLF
jgi:hypothetical protein